MKRSSSMSSVSPRLRRLSEISDNDMYEPTCGGSMTVSVRAGELFFRQASTDILVNEGIPD
jgi:hypothetical protein